MSRPTPTAPPALTSIAEVIHASAGPSAPVLVALSPGATSEADVHAYIIPSGVRHPADPLVGVRVPDRWSALGLVATGRMRPLAGVRRADLDPASQRLVGPACVTTIIGRDGSAANVFGPAEAPTTITDEHPVGWVADALCRSLGRPTPPPDDSPASWIDGLWLDRLAPGVLGGERDSWSWPWMADQHPLRGDGPAPTPADLAMATVACALDHPWPALRRRHGPSLIQAQAPVRPPGPDMVVDPDGWFDDGSFSRWVQRGLPPANLLWPDLLAVLPPTLGHQLLEGLAATGPASSTCDDRWDDEDDDPWVDHVL